MEEQWFHGQPDIEWSPTGRLHRRQPPLQNLRPFEAAVAQRVREERQARSMEAAVKVRHALIDAYGEDTHENGTVVSFRKRYRAGSPEYIFAAVKANDKWYPSGMSLDCHGQGLSWDTFVERLVDGVPAVGFCVMVPEPPEIGEPLASEIQHAMDHPETLVTRERPQRDVPLVADIPGYMHPQHIAEDYADSAE